jgi:predicted ATPase/DNA-binding XRE family transcriptional regulator
MQNLMQGGSFAVCLSLWYSEWHGMELDHSTDILESERSMTVVPPTTFGELLKHFRRAAGLSQDELAEQAHLSRDTISTLERGSSHAPRSETLTLLVKALNLAPFDQARLEAAARQQRFALTTTLQYGADLPVPLTSLLGREQEIAAIVHLLEQHAVRLLTLTGTAGVGKTRLSVHIATILSGVQVEHAVLVDLTSISQPSLVLPAIAQALGVTERQGHSWHDLVVTFLRDRSWLLVLDNFEQVVEAAPDVAAIMSTCPHLKMMVTSRAPLRVRGEHLFPVPPLAFPTDPLTATSDDMEQYPALALFAQRAYAVKPDVALPAPIVAAICQRVDGLPLAIELAAARIPLLSPAALLAHLNRGLPALARGARDLPDRQQTMHDAIAWSYQLLDARRQRLFRELCVFTGGCTIEAVESVCTSDGDLLEDLAALVDQSLVQSIETAQEQPRVRLLTTLRDFGLEQAQAQGDMDALRRRHAEYYLSLTEQAKPSFHRAEQSLWLARLEEDFENLRAALQWAQEHNEVVYGLRLATTLWWLWYVRGHFGEGRRWLDAFLALPPPPGDQYPAAIYAEAYRYAGRFAYELGEYARAALLFEREMALSDTMGDTRGKASVLASLALIAERQDDLPRAATLGAESLALFRASGQMGSVATTLNNLGDVYFKQGNYRHAITLQEESLVILRAIGDQVTIARIDTNIGESLMECGDYMGAAARFDESLAISLEIEDQQGIAHNHRCQTHLFYVQAEYQQAKALGEKSLAHFRELGDSHGIIQVLNLLANVALAQGKLDVASQLAEESSMLAQELGERRAIADARMTLAGLALAQEDTARATALYGESLRQFDALGQRGKLAQGLEGLAIALSMQGLEENATRLLGVAAALREAMGTPLHPTDRDKFERCLSALQAKLGKETFAASWNEGQAMPIEQLLEAVDRFLPGI